MCLCVQKWAVRAEAMQGPYHSRLGLKYGELLLLHGELQLRQAEENKRM